MWNIFWSCVLIRCKWWLKRPLELCLLFFIVPITMVLLVSIMQSVAKQEGIPLAVVDEDRSVYSKTVLERIADKPFIAMDIVDREQAVRLLETNRVEAVIILSEGFMDNLLQEKKKEIVEMLVSPTSVAQGFLSEVISSEVLRLSSNGMAAHYITNNYEQLHLLSPSDRSIIKEDRAQTRLWQEAWDHSDSYWEPEPLMSIVFLEQNDLSKNEQIETNTASGSLVLIRYELQLLMGYFTILILFVFIFLQQWLVEEKMNGIQNRIKSLGVSPFSYILGHSFPALLFVIIQGVVTTLFVFWQYDFVIPLTWELILLLILYMVTAFSLSLCIAIWVRTLVQLQVIGVFLIILTSFMGGSFMDLGEFVHLANGFSYVTPQGWFLKGWKESLPIIGEKSVITIIWPSLLALAGFIVLFTLLSVGRWRKT